MNRRGFLRSLGFLAAGLTLDPERLLWVPGERTIFVPPVTGWHSGNAFVTPDWITKEACRMLVENLRFSTTINRSYDEQFAAHVGDTVRVHLPKHFAARN